MFEQAMSKQIKAVLIFCEIISPNSRDLGMEIILWSYNIPWEIKAGGEIA